MEQFIRRACGFVDYAAEFLIACLWLLIVGGFLLGLVLIAR